MTAVLESAELSPLAAFVAVVGLILMVYVLITCVCSSRSNDKEVDLITVTTHNPNAIDTPALSSPQKDQQLGTSSNEVELNIAKYNHSSQNGHTSKGENHATDTKLEGNGKTSTGSSPRSTGVRGLPEPPKSQSSKEKGRIGQLPEIPVDSKTSPRRSVESSRVSSPGGSTVVKTPSLDTVSVNKIEKHDQKPNSADTDYDHIEEAVTKNIAKRQSNYDHVVLVGNAPKVILAKTSRNADDQKPENIYAGVDDDIEVVQASSSTQELHYGNAGAKADKYKQLEIDLYEKAESDTYCKVNDIDQYGKDTDAYNKVVEVDVSKKVEESKDYKEVKPVMADVEDDYAHLVEGPMTDERNVSNQSDPYARVKDDSPYARVKDDPLLKDIEDDPYNKVQDSSEEVDIGILVPESAADYAKVNKGHDEYQTVKKNRLGPIFGIASPESQLQASDTEQNIEYAVVSKVRKPIDTINSERNNDASPRSSVELASTSLAPPEPPRDYCNGAREENSVDLESDTQVTILDYNYIDETTGHVVECTQAEGKKEPPYTKVTARESLASMNARVAQNTYEVLPDADNLYATVEGGSGDGEVRRSVVKQNEAQNASSDHYTEIKAGAPAPPSLDSLHMMARVHQGDITKRLTERKPGDSGGYYNVSPGSPASPPATHPLTISGGELRVASATPNEGACMVASFDPDYQSVVVSNSLEESEFDPNYESVDEAKAKTSYKSIDESKNNSSPKSRRARGHVYEEVTVPEESAFAKQHALNKHTYEDIKDINGKRREDGSLQNSGDVQRGFLGHIRKLSGDHSKVVKRKSNDFKDKDKKRESKRKVSESKESKKSDATKKSGEQDKK